MMQELVFNISYNNYTEGMHYFKANQNQININNVDTDKIVLTHKVSYGKHGANEYYIGYLNGGFRPLCIIIKELKFYTDHMNILANNKEFLKYIEVRNKIKSLFNEKFNKRGLYNRPVYNNEYIKTKISRYNDVFKRNKKLTKDEYYGHSILLIESIYEAENKHYPQTFLDNFFCKT